MDPEEIEFLAEKTLIDIVPNFNSNVIHFISGDIGPFKSAIMSKAPLWFAVNLKQQHKCAILPPFWLNTDFLEDLLLLEKSNKGFMKMPSEHYMIEAKILLNCATDNIPNSSEIRTLIKDIWDVRMSKIRTSMVTSIRGEAKSTAALDNSTAALDNLTMMEINSLRPLLPHSLDQLYRIRHTQRSSSQSQNNTTLSLNTSRT